MNTRMVRITVHKSEKYDESFPPGELLGFSAWLNERVAEIPAEYRRNADIDLGYTLSYDSIYPTVEIHYERPETPEEQLARESEALQRAKAQEWCDRRLFAELKARFEPAPQHPEGEPL